MSQDEKKELVKTPRSKERRLAKKEDTTWSTGIDDLFEDFRRNFDSYMAPFMPMRTWMPQVSGGFPIRAPLIDILDQGNNYLIKAELPGFTKDMVDVQLNKDTLVLRAENRTDVEENEGYLHRERTYTRAERSINFPEEVNPDSVEAKMKDGVLELKISKKEPRPEEKMRKVQL
jgi:HSP20 family protein